MTKLLSQPGLKQLGKNELDSQIAGRELSSADAELFSRIRDQVLEIDQRLDAVESLANENRKSVQRIAANLDERTAEFSRIVVQLRQPIVDLAFPPKVELCIGRTETLKEIANAVGDITWTALSGTVGTGKTQLAVLLADYFDTNVVRVPFRDLGRVESAIRLQSALKRISSTETAIAVDDLVAKALAALPVPAAMFLDDLPRLQAGDDLSSLLVKVCKACHRRRIRLVSLSHYALPAGITEALTSSQVVEMPVPKFTVQEAMELFRIHGAGDAFLASEFAAKLVSRSDGNPTLLAAHARGLSEAGWPTNGEDVQQGMAVTEEILARFLESVTDERTRESMYRACVVLGEFTFEDHVALTSIDPIVSRPRERLTQLTGLWIERLQNSKMTVCPLLKPLAETELDIAVRKSANLILAKRTVASKDFDVVQAFAVMHYLEQAEEFNYLAMFIISGLRSVEHLPADQVQAILDRSHLSLAQDNIDPELRVVLRSVQARASLECGLDYSVFLDDFDLVRSEVPRNELQAADLLAIPPFVSDLAEHEFGRAIDYVRGLIRYVYSVDSLSVSGEHIDALKFVPELILHLPMHVKCASQLLIWLDVVGELPSEKLELIFRKSFAEEASQAAFSTVWMNEHLKLPGEQRFDLVLEAYEDALQTEAIQRLPLLRALNSASMMVVCNEYLNDLPRAEQIAAEALAEHRSEARCVFLIHDYMARQYLATNDREQAISHFRIAMAVETKSFIARRPRLCIEASTMMPAGSSEAKSLLNRAIEISNSPQVQKYDLNEVAAHGELAIRHWLENDNRNAFLSIESATIALMECRDDTNPEDWCCAAATLNTVLGFITSVVAAGEPPPSNPNGQPSVKPFIGIFTKFSFAAGMWYQLQNGDLLGPVVLPNLLSEFAAAVGEDERCWIWATRGLDRARELGLYSHHALLCRHAAAALIDRNRLVDSIGLMVEGCVAAVAAKINREAGLIVDEPGTAASSVLGNKPNENWDLAEVWAIGQGVLPVFIRIADLSINDAASAKACAVDVSATISEVAEASVSPGRWKSVIQCLKDTFISPVASAELYERGRAAAKADQTAEFAMHYIAATVVPSRPLRESALLHCHAVHAIELLFGSGSPLTRQVVAPFIIRFWQNVFDNERFRLSSPNSAAEAFKAALVHSDGLRVQAIFAAVLPAVGATKQNLSGSVRAWLERLKG